MNIIIQVCMKPISPREESAVANYVALAIPTACKILAYTAYNYGIGDVGIRIGDVGSNVSDDFNHILSFYDIIMIKNCQNMMLHVCCLWTYIETSGKYQVILFA